MANPNQDRLRSHFESRPATDHASGWDDLWKEGKHTFKRFIYSIHRIVSHVRRPHITHYLELYLIHVISNTRHSTDTTPLGTFIPWDRGFANPALIDYLAHQTSPPLSDQPNPTPGAPQVGTIDGTPPLLPSPLKEDGTRRKALVPGCGRGYDVALLASWGYDAYGLEVSVHAQEKAEAFLKSIEKGAVDGEYAVNDERVGQGVMKCLLGDYFEDGWVKAIGASVEGGFDVIYDNTVSPPLAISLLLRSLKYQRRKKEIAVLTHTEFLCALPPSLRPRWALRTSQLLSPTGILICLEFPTHKPAASQGPPWSLPPTVHLELLKRPGEEIEYNTDGVVVASDREESKDALVRVAHWTPRRTHEVAVIKGVVRDCVSVWRHKSSP